MITFFIENMWVLWLACAAGFLILEAMSSALLFIWFVPGAVITSIMSVWIKSPVAQLIIFILLSAVFVFFCRRFFRKSHSESLDDTDQKLIGKTAVVKEDISQNEGKVLLGDVYWRAVSNTEIHQGESVVITNVNGNVLTVDKK